MLSLHRFTHGDWGPAIGSMVLIALGAMCIDMMIAGWRESTMQLSLLDLVAIAAGGTVTLGIARRVRAHFELGMKVEPRRLAAALERELHVAGQDRAEVERLELSVERAFVLPREGVPPRLLLDCGHDGWVLLSPQDGAEHGVLPHPHRHFIVERLRWTHAILSVMTSGPKLEPTRIDVPEDALADLEQCEVFDVSQLPPALTAAVSLERSAYRA